MNTDTGKVYRGDEAIAQAKARGENLVEVSTKVADRMEAQRAQILIRARAARANQRRGAKARMRRRSSRLKAEKTSRRKNRR